MSNLVKGLILIIVILAIGVGLVVWKKKAAGHSAQYNSISRAEVEMLLTDVAKSNPMLLKRLAEDPSLKKKQMDNLKQLLAFASQAQREGLANEPHNKQELENIKAEILAVNYDREINKDKGPMPPFGFITEEQVNGFWGDTSPQSAPDAGWFSNLLGKVGLGSSADTRTREAAFNDFINAKIESLKAGNPEMKDREVSEEERTQAREMFAKVSIYKKEFEDKAKSGELSKEFVDKANLQVKLQQAQFLAKLYSQKAADKMKVTDEDVQKYIKDHPELDPASKREKAQGILDRAKAGEDFAALANEFTEDPGNKGTDGTPQGGIYKDVPKGRMVAPFEQAALALEAGQVSPELVETDFGYHIIKLERKLEAKEQDGRSMETYDVRHILISTGIKDPDSPGAREVPVKDFVRNKLEQEKEDTLLENIVAQNNVQVPDDFTIPEISEADMEQMKQKQQFQMPQGMQPGPDVHGGKPHAEPKKPEGKKK